MDEYLNEEVMNRFNLVDAAKVMEMKKQYKAGAEYLFNRLWLLIVLHQWMVAHKN